MTPEQAEQFLDEAWRFWLTRGRLLMLVFRTNARGERLDPDPRPDEYKIKTLDVLLFWHQALGEHGGGGILTTRRAIERSLMTKQERLALYEEAYLAAGFTQAGRKEFDLIGAEDAVQDEGFWDFVTACLAEGERYGFRPGEVV